MVYNKQSHVTNNVHFCVYEIIWTLNFSGLCRNRYFDCR